MPATAYRDDLLASPLAKRLRIHATGIFSSGYMLIHLDSLKPAAWSVDDPREGPCARCEDCHLCSPDEEDL